MSCANLDKLLTLSEHQVPYLYKGCYKDEGVNISKVLGIQNAYVPAIIISQMLGMHLCHIPHSCCVAYSEILCPDLQALFLDV